MHPQKQVQSKFFKALEESGGYTAVLEDTMEVLGLRKGAVYKRMNGDTALTTAELVELSNHFNFSLDDNLLDGKFISFTHPFMEEGETKNIDFLRSISTYLETLRSNEKSKLTYLANELPLFYYISRKYIFTFLMSIWNHLHWEEGALKINETVHLNKNMEVFRSEITDYYDAHPVTEIWNSNMMSNLYQQVIFCITIRAFDSTSFIQHLMSDIKNLIEHLKDITLHGIRKTSNSEEQVDLSIYLNEFGNYLNVLLYEGEDLDITFIAFDYPQFIKTNSGGFNKYSKKWIEKIKKRSVLISSAGYQYRELFFLKLEQDFKGFQEKVNNLLKVYY